MAPTEDSLPTQLRALTIAGFDPSGGAGVLADVRTFAGFGILPAAAITSITFQNPAQVSGAVHQTAVAVRGQVLPLLEAYKIVCAKTGMLPTREIVREVARLFRETDLPAPVVDPVLVSSSGQRLMDENAIGVLIDELLPLARLVTPNIPEAEQLTGLPIISETAMSDAAAMIRQMGARAVLVKGGHLKRQKAVGTSQKRDGSKWKAKSDEGNERDESLSQTEEAIDVLDDEGRITVFRGEFVHGAELHGSGCVLSAAIAAGLGKGMTLEDSVGTAKKFVLEAIRNSLREGREKP